MSLPSEIDLSRLRGAHPDAAATRRIVQGALERSAARASPWTFLVPAVTAAALGFALVAAYYRFAPAETAPIADGDRRPSGRQALTAVTKATSTPSLSTGAVALAERSSQRFLAGRHHVELEAGGRVQAVRVDPQRVELRVEQGLARFEVAHLAADEIFRVEAGLLTVEAVGTLFEVELEGDCARVAVREGQVSVRRAGHVPEAISQSEGNKSWCAHPGEAETLSDEERLVFDALDRVQRGSPGDLESAVESLRAYDQRFPAGAYQEEALYYLARLSQKLGRADDAQRYGARFLARLPKGRRADELRSGR